MRLTIPEPVGPASARRVSSVSGVEEWVIAGVEGDDVPVRVARPGDGVRGIVVVGHGLAGSRSSRYITGASRTWSTDGIAVLSFDFPLSGDRADADRPLEAVHGPAGVRQAIGDISRVVGFARTEFPGLPIVYLGFSNGAILGTLYVGQAGEVDALCLVVAGSRARQVLIANPHLPDDARTLVEATDPATYAPGVGRRPVLMLCADRDEQFDRIAAFDLYDAFDSPKELAFFPGTHTDWPHPGPVYRRITAFIEEVISP